MYFAIPDFWIYFFYYYYFFHFKQLLDEVFRDTQNYQWCGKCYR